MNKVPLILISIVFLLTSCKSINPDRITLDEVISSVEKQQLVIKENKEISNDNIFGMKLNGVKPSSYELDGKLLSVYIYNSAEERKKGLEDFHGRTATMDIVSYNVYEAENVLIFYVYEHDITKEVEFDDEIKEALSELRMK
jgi:protoporphyrinogen oxidase